MSLVWVWVNKKADYFRNPALASRSAIGVRIYTIRLEGRFLHLAYVRQVFTFASVDHRPVLLIEVPV
jgi:hypothetical protein